MCLVPDKECPRLECGEEALGVLPRLQELVPQQVRTLARVAQQKVLLGEAGVSVEHVGEVVEPQLGVVAPRGDAEEKSVVLPIGLPRACSLAAASCGRIEQIYF